MLGQKFQTALHLLYPPRCLSCGETVESDFGLCGTCWSDTPFIGGTVCDCCGAPLPGDGGLSGESGEAGEDALCDDCIERPRPWLQGRAALIYRDNARRLVLALKHGDRHDIVRPATLWLAQAVRPILTPNMIVAPVPLHWTRLLKRRFNQSALLSQALARHIGLAHCPDLLARPGVTGIQQGRDFDARFVHMSGAITAHPRRTHLMRERSVLIVDDVMTSGATLHAAAEACLAGGAREVRVAVLARVTKDA